MIKKICSSLIIFISFYTHIYADIKSPIEPAMPNKENNKKSQSDILNVKFKAQVSVFFANKNKLNGTIEFQNDKIYLSFYQGGRLHNVIEKISNIHSVDFNKWEKKKTGGRYVYYHSNAIVSMRDGSVYNCINISMLNKVKLSGKTGNIDCYSYFYSVRNENKKSNNPVIYSEINPHPDTLVKIIFTLESGNTGIEDLIPMFFK
jgi:hypothetical protein